MLISVINPMIRRALLPLTKLLHRNAAFPYPLYAVCPKLDGESPVDNADNNELQPWVLNHIKHPFALLEWRSEIARGTLVPLTTTKLSTSHSYQTLRSSVWRHMLISISELAGSCTGSYSTY